MNVIEVGSNLTIGKKAPGIPLPLLVRLCQNLKENAENNKLKLYPRPNLDQFPGEMINYEDVQYLL